MPFDLSNCLVIGVSSRSLFDLSHENSIFENEGLNAYREYQLRNEATVLKPGPAFPLIRAILNLNERFTDRRRTEVIVMSRNSAESSLRIFNSIDHYQLDITRAALTGGAPLPPYLGAFNVSLFLSQHAGDVETATMSGVPAALLYALPENPLAEIGEIRIAFDGDAVLFSDEAELVYQNEGLEAFLVHEKSSALRPLPEGPFAKLLRKLAVLQSECQDPPGLRTALVTARGRPAHERAIRTLSAWGLEVNEAFFLGGMSKAEVLRAFGAHMFFDDHSGHCDDAAKYVPTGLVIAAARKRSGSGR